jgi:hypothetical protein
MHKVVYINKRLPLVSSLLYLIANSCALIFWWCPILLKLVVFTPSYTQFTDNFNVYRHFSLKQFFSLRYGKWPGQACPIIHVSVGRLRRQKKIKYGHP